MEYRYTVECLDADYHGKSAVVLTGSEEAIRALGSHFLREVRILVDLEPDEGLPEPTPPKIPLTDEQVQAGTDLLVVWHSILPRLDCTPKMREDGGLWFRPDPRVEISLDYFASPDTWRWTLSVMVDGKSKGPASAVVYFFEQLPVRVRRILECYIRDYQAGSKKGPERYEAGHYVQDYRDNDLPAVPWCRWVIERMPE